MEQPRFVVVQRSGLAAAALADSNPGPSGRTGAEAEALLPLPGQLATAAWRGGCPTRRLALPFQKRSPAPLIGRGTRPCLAALSSIFIRVPDGEVLLPTREHFEGLQQAMAAPPPTPQKHQLGKQKQKKQRQQQQQQRAKQQQHGGAAAAQRQASEDDQQQQQQLAQSSDPEAAPSSRHQNLKMLFAGAMSAVVSRTFTAPLERLKMDQVLRASTTNVFATCAKIYGAEGLPGFWRGNILNILRTAPFKALNFFCFDVYHKALLALSAQDGNPERFWAGAGAGITATLVCFPLDVLRTRLMASTGRLYGGPLATVRGMLRHEGPSAFYTGCLPAVVGMAPAGAVFYGVYDLLKHNHLAWQQHYGDGGAADHRAAAKSAAVAVGPLPSGKALDPCFTLLYGGLAGACSELVVYPLEVIRRRMQLASMTSAAASAAGRKLAQQGAAAVAAARSGGGGSPVASWAQAVGIGAAILRTEGMHGLYAGLLPNMLQVFPSAALSFYTYETLKRVLGVV